MRSVAAEFDSGSREEAHEWLPPSRLRRYQWQKAVGAVLMVGIFCGWLWIQWSNPLMRAVSLGLIGVTAWVLGRSVWDDIHRAKGRQVVLTHDMIRVTTPSWQREVQLTNVAWSRWIDPSVLSMDEAEGQVESQGEAGLWLYDRNDKPLVHLDSYFLADPREARAFLGWARRRADLGFEVRWE